MAEELLAKESIGLPDIIKILGERPFPMKETVKEYLKEMMERKDKEDAEDAEKQHDTATEDESKKDESSDKKQDEKKE